MEHPNPDLNLLLVTFLSKCVALDIRLDVIEKRVADIEELTDNHDTRLRDLESDENSDYYPTR